VTWRMRWGEILKREGEALTHNYPALKHLSRASSAPHCPPQLHLPSVQLSKLARGKDQRQPKPKIETNETYQPAIPPFKILPFCFNDRCRLDNQLPEPFAPDDRLGRWTMGLGLDKVSGKVLEEEGEEGEDFR